MISTEKITAGNWQAVYDEVVRRFERIPFRGDYGFIFSEDVSIGDFHCVLAYVENGQLKAKATTWTKLNDYRKWKSEPGFTPGIYTLETTLSNDEKEYFGNFFDELRVLPEGQILEPVPGIVLDGSHHTLRLFSHGNTVREFKWGPNIRTRGLMEQLMKLSKSIRKEK